MRRFITWAKAEELTGSTRAEVREEIKRRGEIVLVTGAKLKLGRKGCVPNCPLIYGYSPSGQDVTEVLSKEGVQRWSEY